MLNTFYKATPPLELVPVVPKEMSWSWNRGCRRAKNPVPTLVPELESHHPYLRQRENLRKQQLLGLQRL